MNLKYLLLPLTLAFAALHAPAQDATFISQLTKLDHELFDAYNKCELDKFKSLLADDLEFYHDKSGVMHGAAAVTEAVKNNICGKVRRELIPGTLQSFPMNNYGAVQTGEHRFYEKAAKTPGPEGKARFITLWKNDNGVWKATRIISYDHVGLKN